MSLQGPTSYQIPGRAPKPRRPGAVTAASILMFVAAGLLATMGALATVEGLQTRDELPSQLPPDIPVTPDLVATATIVGGVVYALFAAGFVTLGLLIRPGRNPARIVTWVVTGVFGLCCGCTDVLGAVGTAVPVDTPTDSGPFGSAVASSRPGWYTAGSVASSVALVLVCLVVIVLLSLPVANDYFRKEQETWVPPAWPTGPGGGYAFPGPAYPQPPAIPQYPYPPVAAPQPPQPPPAAPPATTPPAPTPAVPTPPVPPVPVPPVPVTEPAAPPADAGWTPPVEPPRSAATPWEPPDPADH